MTSTQKCIGIIGGLGILAGADVHRKMLRGVARDAYPGHYRILYQHHHFDGDDRQPGGGAALHRRQLYIYDPGAALRVAGADGCTIGQFIGSEITPTAGRRRYRDG